MHINFISLAKDINDKKGWSGTPYMVMKSLQSKGHILHVVNFLPDNTPIWHRVVIRLYRYMSAWNGKRYLYWFTDMFQRSLRRQYRKLNVPECDLTFVVGQSFFIPPMLPSRTPIVYLCDATFSAVENYYPEFSDLFASVSLQGNRICRDALLGCSKIIMSSAWAKRHAVEDYKIAQEVIDVVEFGANLESDLMGRIVKEYTNKHKFTILFSGVHWERKGGDVAVECCDELIRLGYDVELIVAGVDVPASCQRDYIRSVGFLNKNVEEEYKKYVRIMEEADFLLFPSHAECSAIALCEAAGFALPVFAYRTGGLENYVSDGYNGVLLNESSRGKEFASEINEAIIRGLLNDMSANAGSFLLTLNSSFPTRRATSSAKPSPSPSPSTTAGRAHSILSILNSKFLINPLTPLTA